MAQYTAKGYGDKPGLLHSKIWLWFHLTVRHLRVAMALVGLLKTQQLIILYL